MSPENKGKLSNFYLNFLKKLIFVLNWNSKPQNH